MDASVGLGLRGGTGHGGGIGAQPDRLLPFVAADDLQDTNLSSFLCLFWFISLIFYGVLMVMGSTLRLALQVTDLLPGGRPLEGQLCHL
jgi:hypothetical protein